MPKQNTVKKVAKAYSNNGVFVIDFRSDSAIEMGINSCGPKMPNKAAIANTNTGKLVALK
ncbi:MAG: hypothetical protein IPP56_14295 [Bacteroidetes bacterium]|nr:hypothetical protein [Bacteroidota bacterium]MBK9671800.1 hypothetical protein [Bacteroidota bacterium]MBK9800832.1 hypothetical protein [Bacteroidota bacterium]